MKWSICTTGFKETNIRDLLFEASTLRLDGLEVWVGHLTRELDDYGSLAELQRLLADTDLRIPAVAGYYDFHRDPDDSVQRMKQDIRLCNELGSPLIRTFLGTVPSAEANTDDWNRSLEALERALGFAYEAGVTIGLELHNNTFADRTETVLSVLRHLDHPNLRLIFDGFNLVIDEQDQIESLHALYPWVVHVHLKNYAWNRQDWNLSVAKPVLEGDADNRKLLGCLRDKGYDGYISLEYFGEQALDRIAESLSQIRAL